MDFENLRIKDIRLTVRYSTLRKSWRTENRDDHIIGLQMAGEAVHDLGYKKLVFSRNTPFFLSQKDDYSVTMREQGLALSIHFTTYEPLVTDSFCLPAVGQTEIVRLFERIEHALRTGDKLSAISYLYQLCALYAKTKSKAYNPRDERAQAVKNYIDLHFSDDECLPHAFSAANLSPRRLGSLFRACFNETPGRYLLLRRIAFAKDLLRDKALTVTEVAALSGFSDLYYFSKCFKKETGYTPSGWRLSHSVDRS